MIVDLKPRLGEPILRDLLACAIGFPTPEKIDRVTRLYAADPTWHLVGAVGDDMVDGCVGYHGLEPGCSVIRHIAVRPGARGKGIGRLMIRWLRTTARLTSLTAETDIDAVGFYRRCGFRTTSLGEVYPGVERFRCELTTDPIR